MRRFLSLALRGAIVLASLIGLGLGLAWLTLQAASPERLVAQLEQRLGGQVEGEASLRFGLNPQLSLRAVSFVSADGSLGFQVQRVEAPLQWRDLARLQPSTLSLEGGTFWFNWQAGTAPLTALETWRQPELVLRNVRLGWRGWAAWPLEQDLDRAELSLRPGSLALSGMQDAQPFALRLSCQDDCNLRASFGVADTGRLPAWRFEGRLDVAGQSLSGTLMGQHLALPTGDLLPSEAPTDFEASLQLGAEGAQLDNLRLLWADARALGQFDLSPGRWEAQLSLNRLVLPDLRFVALDLPGLEGQVALTLDQLRVGEARLDPARLSLSWSEGEWQGFLEADGFNQTPLQLAVDLHGLRSAPGLDLRMEARALPNQVQALSSGLRFGMRQALAPLLEPLDGTQNLLLQGNFAPEQTHIDSLAFSSAAQGHLTLRDWHADAQRSRAVLDLRDWQLARDLELAQLAEFLPGASTQEQGWDLQVQARQGNLTVQGVPDAFQVRSDQWALPGWTASGFMDPQGYALLLTATEPNLADTPLPGLNLFANQSTAALRRLLGPDLESARLSNQRLPGESLHQIETLSPNTHLSLDAAWQRDFSLLRIEALRFEHRMAGEPLLLVGRGEGDPSQLQLETDLSLGALTGQFEFRVPLGQEAWTWADLDAVEGRLDPVALPDLLAAVGLTGLAAPAQDEAIWDLAGSGGQLLGEQRGGEAQLSWSADRFSLTAAEPLRLETLNWSPRVEGQALNLQLAELQGAWGTMREVRIQSDAEEMLSLNARLDPSISLQASAQASAFDRFDVAVRQSIENLLPDLQLRGNLNQRYENQSLTEPLLVNQASQLDGEVQALTRDQLVRLMQRLAPPVLANQADWNAALDLLASLSWQARNPADEEGAVFSLTRAQAGSLRVRFSGTLDGLRFEGRFNQDENRVLSGTFMLSNGSDDAIPLLGLILSGSLDAPQIQMFGTAAAP